MLLNYNDNLKVFHINIFCFFIKNICMTNSESRILMGLAYINFIDLLMK